MTITRWTAPGFLRPAHRWMREAAQHHGYDISGPIEQPHIRPWSTVFRARTRRGVVFLKCCGPSQAHEPRLTELLGHLAGTRVPKLIARHPRRDWMLLADGGRKLREVLRGRNLLRAWEAFLPRYAEIQLALLGREGALLASGTPDHRLDRLPAAVAAVLEDEAVMSRRDSDRLSADDRRRIRRCLPVIEARGAELDALGIGASVQHDDLHDGNVLCRGSHMRVFDWGDACVSHPFLSLTIALRVAAFRTGATLRDRSILRLRDAYLEPFGRSAGPARLRRAAEIGRRLGMVSRALTQYRVVTLSGGPLDLGESTLAGWLRLLPRVFPTGVD